MDWFAAPGYWFARVVLERGLGLVYLLAFANALHQFPALLGERGLLPVPRYLAQTRFRDSPSLFHLGYSDRGLRLVGWCGVVLAAATVLGLPARRTALGPGAGLAPPLGALSLDRQRGAALLLVRLGESPARGGIPRRLPGQRPDAPAPADSPPLPLARRAGGARRGADQAAGRSLLAGPHLSRLPPRDPADAEPAQLVRPSAAPLVPPTRGPRQLCRAARRAGGALPAAAGGGHRRPDDGRHPGVSHAERQLRLSESRHPRGRGLGGPRRLRGTPRAGVPVAARARPPGSWAQRPP